jgi:outer membrane protein OmpA-like peptidoglycan-associated protein
MKKLLILAVIVMMMVFVTAVQAEVRAGGLPVIVVGDSNKDSYCRAAQSEIRAGSLTTLIADDRIKDCSCPPYCPKVEPPPPFIEKKVEPPPPVVEKKIEPPPPPPPVVAKPVIIEKGRQTLDVKFDFDKSIIKEGYYKDIDNLVQVMKDYPDLNVILEGHTDSVGTAAYNKKLSQERADAVKKYMVEKAGINANRIVAKGFGEEQPIASNDTEEGRLKNRRVEAAVDYLIEK